MDEPILLNNPLLWQQVYSETKVGASVAGYGDRYVPIAPFFIPTLFDTHILLIQTVIPDAQPRWRLGCRVRQFLEPAPVAGLEVQGKEFSIPPNRATLVAFPRLTSQFKLQAWVPYWHRQITLAVYEYSGANQTLLEELITSQTDVIRVDLTRIETKIDAL